LDDFVGDDDDGFVSDDGDGVVDDDANAEAPVVFFRELPPFLADDMLIN
jgi:hypothetical protein